MIKGKIDYSGEYNEKIIVFDSELFVKVKRKYLFLPKFVLSDFNRKVVRYIKQLSKDSTEINNFYGGNEIKEHIRIIIGAVKNYSLIQHIINKTLGLSYTVVDLQTEKNYGHWLKIIQPIAHYSIVQRRYYCKQSIYLTEDILNNKEPADGH